MTVNSATLTNQGTVFANNASLAIQSGVDLTNLASGTLTGGVSGILRHRHSGVS